MTKDEWRPGTPPRLTFGSRRLIPPGPHTSVMDRRHQIDPPKSQQHKKEAADRAPGETATALSKPPVHEQQREIQQPDQDRPMHLGILEVADPFRQLKPDRANDQSGSEEDKAGRHQPTDDQF